MFQGLENKKSPIRKSSTSSEMGPPLRRPPHTSTPSPQPIARTSPTTPPCSSSPQTPLTPTSIQSPSDQSSAIDRLNGAASSDQLIQSVSSLLGGGKKHSWRFGGFFCPRVCKILSFKVTMVPFWKFTYSLWLTLNFLMTMFKSDLLTTMKNS